MLFKSQSTLVFIDCCKYHRIKIPRRVVKCYSEYNCISVVKILVILFIIPVFRARLNRQMDTQTNRQIDRLIKRQIDRQTDTQRIGESKIVHRHSKGGDWSMFRGQSFLPFPFLPTFISKPSASVKSSKNLESEERKREKKRERCKRRLFALRHQTCL